MESDNFFKFNKDKQIDYSTFSMKIDKDNIADENVRKLFSIFDTEKEDGTAGKDGILSGKELSNLWEKVKEYATNNQKYTSIDKDTTLDNEEAAMLLEAGLDEGVGSLKNNGITLDSLFKALNIIQNKIMPQKVEEENLEKTVVNGVEIYKKDGKIVKTQYLDITTEYIYNKTDAGEEYITIKTPIETINVFQIEDDGSYTDNNFISLETKDSVGKDVIIKKDSTGRITETVLLNEQEAITTIYNTNSIYMYQYFKDIPELKLVQISTKGNKQYVVYYDENGNTVTHAKNNDNAWNLSKTFDFNNIDEFYELNPEVKKRGLFVGQNIVVPGMLDATDERIIARGDIQDERNKYVTEQNRINNENFRTQYLTNMSKDVFDALNKVEGFELNNDNTGMYLKFNALEKTTQRFVLDDIIRLSKQGKTPDEIKEYFLQDENAPQDVVFVNVNQNGSIRAAQYTQKINLFDGFTLNLRAWDGESLTGEISIKGFIEDELGLDIKKGEGKELYDALCSVSDGYVATDIMEMFSNIRYRTTLEFRKIYLETKADGITNEPNSPQGKATIREFNSNPPLSPEEAKEMYKAVIRKLTAPEGTVIKTKYDDFIEDHRDAYLRSFATDMVALIYWQNKSNLKSEAQQKDYLNPSKLILNGDIVHYMITEPRIYRNLQRDYYVGDYRTNATLLQGGFIGYDKEKMKKCYDIFQNPNSTDEEKLQVMRETFGTRGVDHAISFSSDMKLIDEATDMALMLYGTGVLSKVFTKGLAMATKGTRVATTVARTIKGTRALTVGEHILQASTSAATFATWDSFRYTVNYYTNGIDETKLGDYSYTYGEGLGKTALHSAAFGTFAYAWGAFATSNLLKWVFKNPENAEIAQKVMSKVKGEFRGKTTFTSTELLSTYNAAQAKAMQSIGKEAFSFGSEIIGFSLYEIGSGVLSGDIEINSVGDIGNVLRGQTKNLLSFKVMGKILFMHKQGKLPNDMIKLGKDKELKIEQKNGKFEVKYPDGKVVTANTWEKVIHLSNAHYENITLYEPLKKVLATKKELDLGDGIVIKQTEEGYTIELPEGKKVTNKDLKQVMQEAQGEYQMYSLDKKLQKDGKVELSDEQTITFDKTNNIYTIELPEGKKVTNKDLKQVMQEAQYESLEQKLKKDGKIELSDEQTITFDKTNNTYKTTTQSGKELEATSLKELLQLKQRTEFAENIEKTFEKQDIVVLGNIVIQKTQDGKYKVVVFSAKGEVSTFECKSVDEILESLSNKNKSQVGQETTVKTPATEHHAGDPVQYNLNGRANVRSINEGTYTEEEIKTKFGFDDKLASSILFRLKDSEGNYNKELIDCVNRLRNGGIDDISSVDIVVTTFFSLDKISRNRKLNVLSASEIDTIIDSVISMKNKGADYIAIIEVIMSLKTSDGEIKTDLLTSKSIETLFNIYNKFKNIEILQHQRRWLALISEYLTDNTGQLNDKNVKFVNYVLENNPTCIGILSYTRDKNGVCYDNTAEIIDYAIAKSKTLDMRDVRNNIKYLRDENGRLNTKNEEALDRVIKKLKENNIAPEKLDYLLNDNDILDYNDIDSKVDELINIHHLFNGSNLRSTYTIMEDLFNSIETNSAETKYKTLKTMAKWISKSNNTNLSKIITSGLLDRSHNRKSITPEQINIIDSIIEYYGFSNAFYVLNICTKNNCKSFERLFTRLKTSDIPMDMQAKILKSLNDSNANVVESLCFDKNLDFPLEHITEFLRCVREDNANFVEKILKDKNLYKTLKDGLNNIDENFSYNDLLATVEIQYLREKSNGNNHFDTETFTQSLKKLNIFSHDLYIFVEENPNITTEEVLKITDKILQIHKYTNLSLNTLFEKIDGSTGVEKLDVLLEIMQSRNLEQWEVVPFFEMFNNNQNKINIEQLKLFRDVLVNYANEKNSASIYSNLLKVGFTKDFHNDFSNFYSQLKTSSFDKENQMLLLQNISEDNLNIITEMSFNTNLGFTAEEILKISKRCSNDNLALYVEILQKCEDNQLDKSIYIDIMNYNNDNEVGLLKHPFVKQMFMDNLKEKPYITSSTSLDDYVELNIGHQPRYRYNIKLDNDKDAHIVGVENIDINKGKLIVTCKTNNGSIVTEFYDGGLLVSSNASLETITDSEGKTVMRTLTKPSKANPGVLVVLREIYDKNGNLVEVKEMGLIKQYGSQKQGSRIEKTFTSPGGVTSRQLIIEGPKGGGTVFEVGDKKFEYKYRIPNENTKVSNFGENNYTANYSKDKIEVTVQKKDGTSETVSLDNSQLDLTLMPLFKKLPVHYLYILAKTGTKIEIDPNRPSNAFFSKSENKIGISQELVNDPFTFAHEFGHLLDEILFNGLHSDPKLKEVFMKELQKYKEQATTVNEMEIDYFVAKDHVNVGGCLTEVIAETNAILSGSIHDSNFLLLRAKLLQENFPETIAYIGSKIEEGIVNAPMGKISGNSGSVSTGNISEDAMSLRRGRPRKTPEAQSDNVVKTKPDENRYVTRTKLTNMLGLKTIHSIEHHIKQGHLVLDENSGLIDLENPVNKKFVENFKKGTRIKKEPVIDDSNVEKHLGGLTVEYCIKNGLLVVDENGKIDYTSDDNQLFFAMCDNKEIGYQDYFLSVASIAKKLGKSVNTIHRDMVAGKLVPTQGKMGIGFDINDPINAAYIKTYDRKSSPNMMTKKDLAAYLALPSTYYLHEPIRNGLLIVGENGLIDTENPTNRNFIMSVESGEYKPRYNYTKKTNETQEELPENYLTVKDLMNLKGISQAHVTYYISTVNYVDAVKINGKLIIDLDSPKNKYFVDNYKKGQNFIPYEDYINPPKETPVVSEPVESIKTVELNPNLVSRSQLVLYIGIKQTAIDFNTQNGRLNVTILNGNKKFYDLSDPKNIEFIEKYRNTVIEKYNSIPDEQMQPIASNLEKQLSFLVTNEDVKQLKDVNNDAQINDLVNKIIEERVDISTLNQNEKTVLTNTIRNILIKKCSEPTENTTKQSHTVYKEKYNPVYLKPLLTRLSQIKSQSANDIQRIDTAKQKYDDYMILFIEINDKFTIKDQLGIPCEAQEINAENIDKVELFLKIIDKIQTSAKKDNITEISNVLSHLAQNYKIENLCTAYNETSDKDGLIDKLSTVHGIHTIAREINTFLPEWLNYHKNNSNTKLTFDSYTYLASIAKKYSIDMKKLVFEDTDIFQILGISSTKEFNAFIKKYPVENIEILYNAFKLDNTSSVKDLQKAFQNFQIKSIKIIPGPPTYSTFDTAIDETNKYIETSPLDNKTGTFHFRLYFKENNTLTIKEKTNIIRDIYKNLNVSENGSIPVKLQNNKSEYKDIDIIDEMLSKGNDYANIQKYIIKSNKIICSREQLQTLSTEEKNRLADLLSLINGMKFTEGIHIKMRILERVVLEKAGTDCSFRELLTAMIDFQKALQEHLNTNEIIISPNQLNNGGINPATTFTFNGITYKIVINNEGYIHTIVDNEYKGISKN